MFYKNLVIICGVIIGFLAGCGQVKELAIKDIFRSRLSADVTTLDPAMVVDVSGGMLTAKLFNGLVKYGSGMKIVPDIAKNWDVSEDGKIYTFYLKSDIKFTHGREVEASDFKYSIQRVLNPKTRSPRTWVFEKILGAEEYMQNKSKDCAGLVVKDKYTLQIILKEPFAPFLGFLAMPAGYVVPKEKVEYWGEDFSKHVIGTGPFKLERWLHDEKIVLVRNPDYFDSKPKVKILEYRIIPEELTAWAEFEAGNLDAMAIPMAEFDRITNDPKWQKYIVSQAGMNVYYLGLNCQKPPFDKIEIRQALNYAIDKEAILKTVLKNCGIPSHGPIPPGLQGYSTKLKPYEYNPQKAKELLIEAEFPDGFNMKIYQKYSREVLEITEILQAQLKEVGIKVKIIQLEWSALKEMINQGKTEAFYLAWVADYPDAENFLTPLFHSKHFGSGGNRAFYKNQDIDKLIEQAQQTTQTKERIKLYQQIESKIYEEAPWIFLWHQKEFSLHQPWVKGYKSYPICNADKGTSIEIIK
ncbi:MAG: ABC transporter substrate-binding protein [bacterium]